MSSTEKETKDEIYRGGLRIGEEVLVNNTELPVHGWVIAFVPKAPEVVVDHGLHTRVYHWANLDYPE